MLKFKKLIGSIKYRLSRVLVNIRKFLQQTHPYGLFGLSVWDVGTKFYLGLTQSSIDVRASAIAFNFFLAMFPAMIFFFTLIPYLPIENFSDNLMIFLSSLMPDYAFETIESTIEDITTRRRGTLLSFGFIASIYFATSGFSTMISTFNETVNATERRSWLTIQLTSILLILILTILVAITIILITFNQAIFDYLIVEFDLIPAVAEYAFLIMRWLITICFFYFSVSMLYYWAPTKKDRFHFFSPGATVATILGIILLLGFTFFINNFSTYNTLYGSIGTLIVLLVWIKITAFILIIGFELNAGIRSSQVEKSYI